MTASDVVAQLQDLELVMATDTALGREPQKDFTELKKFLQEELGKELQRRYKKGRKDNEERVKARKPKRGRTKKTHWIHNPDYNAAPRSLRDFTLYLAMFTAGSWMIMAISIVVGAMT